MLITWKPRKSTMFVLVIKLSKPDEIDRPLRLEKVEFLEILPLLEEQAIRPFASYGGIS